MDKKLHLHIGSPKTGTTYLQQALFYNKEKLSKQGFSYPGNEFSHQKLFFATNCKRKDWARQFRGAKTATVEKVVNNYLTTLEKDILGSECEQYIMSTEDLFISNQTYIQNLLSYLDNFFSEVKVYVFLRDPVEYYRSYQQELVKARSYITSPYIFKYPIKEVVTAWQNFCETKVIGYHPDKDSLKVLAEKIGFAFDNFSKNKSPNNSSMSIQQIALLEKVQRNLYADSDNILKIHLKAITQISAPFTTKAELQQWVKPVVYKNHQDDLEWLNSEHDVNFLNNEYTQMVKASSSVIAGEQVGVRDVYQVRDENLIEKYESLVIDLLLKKLVSA